jgi:hypothetical protein
MAGGWPMTLKSMTALTRVLATASLLLPAVAQGQSVTYTYAYQGLALPSFRDSANIISIANVFVPKAILITKGTANVEIDYPHPGDLNLFMYSPIQTRTKLLERDCGSQGSVANVTFEGALGRDPSCCSAPARPASPA